MLKEAFTLLALVCCAAAEYTVTVNAKSSVSQRLLRKPCPLCPLCSLCQYNAIH